MTTRAGIHQLPVLWEGWWSGLLPFSENPLNPLAFLGRLFLHSTPFVSSPWSKEHKAPLRHLTWQVYSLSRVDIFLEFHLTLAQIQCAFSQPTLERSAKASRATAPGSVLLSLAHSSSYSSFQDFSGKVYTSLGMRPPHAYSYTVLNMTLHLFLEKLPFFSCYLQTLSAT